MKMSKAQRLAAEKSLETCSEIVVICDINTGNYSVFEYSEFEETASFNWELIESYVDGNIAQIWQ